MASRKRSTMSSKHHILGTFLLLMALSQSMACPDTCFCIDAFVTCSDFKFLDLALLPPSTDTLILTRGEMEEISSGFLAKATNVKMLEINSLTVKVVRSGAFADLSNLDLFSITNSTFDIVESESFGGLTEVNKFHISDSKFGRVDKHAFANVNNVVDLRIWSSTFDAISDEAFYKLSDITSFQLYQNNITFLGNKLFLGASGIDDITVYKNRIQRVSEESFQNVADVTSRVVIHANIFLCSCDLAWIWSDPGFTEYLASNECIVPGQTGLEVSTFRMADVSMETLCGSTSTRVRAETTEKSNIGDELVSTEDLIRSTDDLFISTLFPRLSSILFASTTVTPSQAPSSSVSISSHLQSSPSLSHKPSVPMTTASELSSKFSSKDSSLLISTISQFSEDANSESHDPTNAHSKYPLTSQTNKSPSTNNNDITGQLAREGSTEPFLEESLEGDQTDNMGSISTSGTVMAKSFSENASPSVVGNYLFIILLSSLSVLSLNSP